MVYKQVSYGDKDTFELAFALADKHTDFYRILQWPRAALGKITEVRPAQAARQGLKRLGPLADCFSSASLRLTRDFSGFVKSVPSWFSLFP